MKTNKYYDFDDWWNYNHYSTTNRNLPWKFYKCPKLFLTGLYLRPLLWLVEHLYFYICICVFICICIFVFVYLFCVLVFIGKLYVSDRFWPEASSVIVGSAATRDQIQMLLNSTWIVAFIVDCGKGGEWYWEMFIHIPGFNFLQKVQTVFIWMEKFIEKLSLDRAVQLGETLVNTIFDTQNKGAIE